MRRALITAAVLAGLSLSAAPAHAQYADPPWSCKKIVKTGGGATKRHRVGSWGTGGLRFYTIKMSVKAQKCRTGTTRILYYLWLDTSGFPSDRHVLIQFQSAGRLHRWKPACNYGRCIYDIAGAQQIPRFGAVPIVDYRVTKKALIRRARIPHGVVQGSAGWGQWVASPPKTYYATIRYRY